MPKAAIKKLESFCRSFQFNRLGQTKKKQKRKTKREESALKSLEFFCLSFDFNDLGLNAKPYEIKTNREGNEERKCEEKKTEHESKRKHVKEKEYKKRLQDFQIQRTIRRKRLELAVEHFLKTDILPERLNCLYPETWSEEEKTVAVEEYKRKARKNEKIREKRKEKRKQNYEKNFWDRVLRLENLQQEINDPSWRWKQRKEYAKSKEKEALKKGQFLKFLFYLDVQDKCKMMDRRYNRTCLSDEVKHELDFNSVPEINGNFPSVSPDEIKNNLDFIPPLFRMTSCEHE